MFDIDYDIRSNCLTIRVAGFWQPEDVVTLSRELGAKITDASAISSDFNAIVESFEFPVQANDVADLLASIMRPAMTRTTGRAAVVVGSHLNKLQAERTLAHPRVRVFMTLADAREWLGAAA